MSEYRALAPFYDRLMPDVDYEKWADFYTELFRLNGVKVCSLLDLACGTGELAYILARRGYDVIGCDVSADMLAEAESKRESGANPMFINQDMRKLDLYGTVDAVVCSLDGINYIPQGDLGKVLGRVYTFLEPGGIFIFDINTKAKFERIDGQCYIAEGESVFCAWQTDFQEQAARALFRIDVFSARGRLWHRETEEHIEYVYAAEQLENSLKESKFVEINQYAELKTRIPGAKEERIFFSAKK